MHENEHEEKRTTPPHTNQERRAYVPPTVEDLGTLESLTGARKRPGFKTTLGAEDILKT